MDEMLKNLEYVSQHSNADNFGSVITQMKGTKSTRDGTNFMLDYMRRNSDDFDELSAFEFEYSNEFLNKADAVVGNTNFEFKSWSPSNPYSWGNFFTGNGGSYTQFLRYLENTSEMDNLKYIFNGAKASETEVKQAFKNLFSGSKKTEIFNAMNPSLRENILGSGNAERFDLFLQAIENTDSNLYKFIKIE